MSNNSVETEESEGSFVFYKAYTQCKVNRETEDCRLLKKVIEKSCKSYDKIYNPEYFILNSNGTLKNICTKPQKYRTEHVPEGLDF